MTVVSLRVKLFWSITAVTIEEQECNIGHEETKYSIID